MSTIVYNGAMKGDHVPTEHQKPTFAIWFRQLLAGRDVTQAEASRLLGVSTGRISEWASGKMVPNSESARKIAKTFLVDEDEVLVAAGRRSEDPVFDPGSPEAQLLPYIRAINWSDRELEMIKTQLRFLAETQRGDHDRK